MANPDRMASGQEVWLSLEFGFQVAQLADGALDEDALWAEARLDLPSRNRDIPSRLRLLRTIAAAGRGPI
jgi:hypothetical protein